MTQHEDNNLTIHFNTKEVLADFYTMLLRNSQFYPRADLLFCASQSKIYHILLQSMFQEPHFSQSTSSFTVRLQAMQFYQHHLDLRSILKSNIKMSCKSSVLTRHLPFRFFDLRSSCYSIFEVAHSCLCNTCDQSCCIPVFQWPQQESSPD